MSEKRPTVFHASRPMDADLRDGLVDAGFRMTEAPLEQTVPPIDTGAIATVATEAVTLVDAAAIAEYLQAFATGLDIEQVPPSIIRIRAVRFALEKLEAALEARYGSEIGDREFIDADGIPYEYAAAGRTVTDPVPLIEGLIELGVSIREIAECITSAGFRYGGGPRQSEKGDLTKVAARREGAAGEQIRELVRTYKDRAYGPKHLQLK